MQRVRFRRLIISLGLASMLSLLLLSGGVTAQNANQVAADKDWASGGVDDVALRTVKVTVNDPDVNRPATVIEGEEDGAPGFDNPRGTGRETPRFGPENYTITNGDTPTAYYVNTYPIVDRNGDGVVNGQDIVVETARGTDGTTTDVTTQVVAVDAVNGAVTLAGGTGNFQLKFNAAVANTTTASDGNDALVVRARGTAQPMELRLLERADDGTPNNFVGQYSATFIVSDNASLPEGVVKTNPSHYDTFNEALYGRDLTGVTADEPSVSAAFYAPAYRMFNTEADEGEELTNTPLVMFTLNADAVEDGKIFDENNAVIINPASPGGVDDSTSTMATE